LLDPVHGTKKESQAIESQAIGRAYRQGQTNKVTVVRFIVSNTVEQVQFEENEENVVAIETPNKKNKFLRSNSSITLAANTFLDD